MSKLINSLKINEYFGHTNFFAQIPPIKINVPPMDHSEDEAGKPESNLSQEPEENLVFVPQMDNRFPIAVLIIVACFGAALMFINMKLLEEIKFDRQILILLSTNVDKMANTIAKLDQTIGQFKEQTVEETTALKSAVNELNSSLSINESSISGLGNHMEEIKSGLDEVNAMVLKNQLEIVAVNDNSQKLQTKLDEISAVSADLVNPYKELKGMFQPAPEEDKK